MSLATPWMPVAFAELGVREIAGPGDNPRIKEYLRATNIGTPLNENDETAWCSAFVCWVLEPTIGAPRFGARSTRSAAARSWATWGVDRTPDLPLAPYGAIAVLSRGAPPAAHVGFVVDVAPPLGRIWLFGGNQGDAVSIAAFPIDRLIALRWPAPS